ncbi:MAG: hypothetical protein SOW24_06680 [Eubacteriales bacterium]|nr:hypothetical protein [Eubacteriales bacterium]
MKCTKCDNEAMENEFLCAECAAKERNINNEEQTKTEKLTEEEVKVEISSAEVENSEDNRVITEQEAPQAANSVPTYVPTASPAYDGFSMNQDAAPHEEKKKEKEKGYDPALVKKMQAQLKPLSTWGFFWREAICFIPIINLAFLFVFAFADGINLNSRAFARSKLIRYLIYTVILLAALVLYFIFQEEIMNVIHVVIDNLYKYIHY